MPTDSLRFLQDEGVRLAQENSQLRLEVTALRQSVRALSTVYAVSQNITPQVDVLLLLSEILDASMAVLKANDGTIMLTDEDTGDLVFTVVRGTAADRLIGYRLPKGMGIAGWVAQHQQPQLVRDVRRDPRFYGQVDDAFGFNTRSMICVPVFLDDGRVLGVIEVLNKTADRDFTQDDLNLTQVVAALAATALRRAERAIEYAEREKRRTTLLSSGPSS
jgi:GAF domain-containing protein